MVKRYIQVTGTGAFIAFILYLYVELATQAEGMLKYFFLALFIVFSVLALVDALRGGLKDEKIVGKVSVKKRVRK